MPLFLTESERDAIHRLRASEPAMAGMYWALLNRVERRAASPGLGDVETTTHWWHYAAEYLTDAALALAIHYRPPETLAAWLRSATLAVVRRPIDDWIGPAFRDHGTQPPQGHLETGHLAATVAIVFDLAGQLFSEGERDEIVTALREKGIALCRAWLDRSRRAANWRCILNHGLAVAGAVLNDAEAITRAAGVYEECADFFQPDGSYGESLQYGNYASYGLVLAREALMRREPGLELSLPAWYRSPRWAACALLYRKPLAGWGATPMARSANFNDSAALHRPTADVLLHIAVQAKQAYPQEAGLARWLFDELYLPIVEHGQHDRATFGFFNDFGFLSLLNWPRAAAAIPPAEAGLPTTAGFECGDAFMRDAWDGRTIVAMRTGAQPLYASGHGHGDFNSFILAHNHERLLVDPGHSCYRNVTHDLECSSAMHNTCTFTDASGRQIQQQRGKVPRRLLGEPPVDEGTRRLLLDRCGEVSVIASETAAAYGDPIRLFTRTWVLCGSNVLFLIDRIASDAPVKTTWNFLLNNRDGLLNLKQPAPDRIVARRGTAGLKLFHLGGGKPHGPFYAFVHDAYHTQPAQLGEGRTGSGMLLRWQEREARAGERTVIHALAFDDPGGIAAWHFKSTDENRAVLEAPAARAAWSLAVAGDQVSIEESVSGVRRVITAVGGEWRLT